jgi:hypothetical protein
VNIPRVCAHTPELAASQFADPPGPVSGHPKPVSAAGGLDRVRPWDSFWIMTIATCGFTPHTRASFSRMTAYRSGLPLVGTG